MINDEDENSEERVEVAPTPEESRRAENRRHSLANLRPWKPGQSGNHVGGRNRKGKTSKKKEIVQEAEAAARENSSRETNLQ